MENEQKTATQIPVIGNAKSGTSAVTGVLRILGVNMGEEMAENCKKANEDVAWAEVGKDFDQMKALADRRDRENDIWGWKDPSLINYLPTIHRFLSNPRYIFVYRDPVAVARRQVKDYRTSRLKYEERIRHHQECNYVMTSFMIAHPDTHILSVSYEKLLTDTGNIVNEIAEYVGLPVSDRAYANCISYVQPNLGYRSVDPYLPDNAPSV